MSMIMAITFIPINLFIVGLFFISNKTAEKPNGNILLGVTLPYNALINAAVIEIINRYRKAYTKTTLVFLALTAPMMLASGYVRL